jgi:hypothetical protein
MQQSDALTRRVFLQRAAAGAATTTVTAGLVSKAWGASVRRLPVIPLPSPERVLADVQTMCGFGPRLPGTPAHARWTNWQINKLAALERYGVQLLDCDSYAFHAWEANSHTLEILDGGAAGSYQVATALVRSQNTGRGGVTGPLVYGGKLPALAISGSDPLSVKAALERYPQELQSWVDALPNSEPGGASVAGSILVVDTDVPLPITTAIFLALLSYMPPEQLVVNEQHNDYKRAWIGPWPETSPFKEKGVKAVVLIADCSYAALEGNFSPHTGAPQTVPGLVVDRDTGAKLRAACASRPTAKATLVAPLKPTAVRGVTAVLPGADPTLGKETIIITSHLDGQNFAEENGTIAALHIMRHFASLPQAQRLRRTLVLGFFPAHMTSEYTVDCDQWLDVHPDLTKRAAAGIAIEHLGCMNWVDDVTNGYHATGVPESYGLWTTQGLPFEIAKTALDQNGLENTSLLHGPLEITIGLAFKKFGIPYVGGIAGPTYLLQVTPNSCLDKFNPTLAAKQTRFYAQLVSEFDKASHEELRKGDPTLGTGIPGKAEATPVSCAPTPRTK